MTAERARKAAATGRTAWWNPDAPHMDAAMTNRLLAQWGVPSLLAQNPVRSRLSRTAVHGPLGTVVWGHGKGGLPSHPIIKAIPRQHGFGYGVQLLCLFGEESMDRRLAAILAADVAG